MLAIITVIIQKQEYIYKIQDLLVSKSSTASYFKELSNF